MNKWSVKAKLPKSDPVYANEPATDDPEAWWTALIADREAWQSRVIPGETAP